MYLLHVNAIPKNPLRLILPLLSPKPLNIPGFVFAIDFSGAQAAAVFQSYGYRGRARQPTLTLC